jgi:hypothetical protein
MGTLIARIAIMIVFGGGGLVLLVVGVRQYFQQKRVLANATQVEAEILVSEVFTSRSGGAGSKPLQDRSTTTHRPDVRFRYTVNRTVHESDLLRPTIIVRSYASESAAAAELAPFPVGARVSAWVDPTLPDKAFLVREASSTPVGFMIIGALLPPVAYVAGLLV